MNMKRIAAIIAALTITALATAGCGGGGGKSTPSVTQPVYYPSTNTYSCVGIPYCSCQGYANCTQ